MIDPTELLRAEVTASRAKQGLPPTIEDPAVLERVAAILRLAEVDEPVPKPRKRRRRSPAGAVVVT
ncbi:MAG: hypothetical protein ACRDQU_02985 [Pseudonocardiaceae bacterium]